MRINRLVAGAVASLLALGAVAPAFADNDRHRGHDRDRREWRDDRRDDRRDHRNDRRETRRDWRDDRRHDRHDRREWRDDRRHAGYYRPAPPPRVVYRPAYRPAYGPAYRPAYGHGPGYGWQVGHRYRDYYRGPIYVVNDYNSYHVRRPPRGHHWVRDDRGNLLLVAIATGILADFVINNR
ncbi:RcnB family protein [Stenotrophomonas sp. WHRI 8082]|uniref:RcnB family protein n=1 Tax=unclassified Stenotrophomonas TaxID=196198 RepID=UPI001784A697|nr:RcnB family protein [Stenotrophomonas sp. CFBP 13718]MBD8695696.1 RcnB family protein [Stenotrophomonas sp. CFBP 13718]